VGVVKQLGQAPGEGGAVSPVNQEPGFAVSYDVLQSTNPACTHGPACGHGLDRRQAEGFFPDGRHDADVRLPVPFHDGIVIVPADGFEPVGVESEVAVRGPDLEVGPFFGQEGAGFAQRLKPLGRLIEAAGYQNNLVFFGPFGLGRVIYELFHVNPARKDVDIFVSPFQLSLH